MPMMKDLLNQLSTIINIIILIEQIRKIVEQLSYFVFVSEEA